MSFTSELQRMSEIANLLEKKTEEMLNVQYNENGLRKIVKKYFKEGYEALAQDVDLIIVLRDFKKLHSSLLNSDIDENDFDKVRKAVIDFDTYGKFNFEG